VNPESSPLSHWGLDFYETLSERRNSRKAARNRTLMTLIGLIYTDFLYFSDFSDQVNQSHQSNQCSISSLRPGGFA
jgi:hypothetical protein